MNNLMLIGYCGKDPEERVTPSGIKILSFSIGCPQYIKGETITVWFQCAHFGDNEFISKNVKKGSAILVSGILAPPRVYQKKDGTHETALEVKVHNVSFSPFKAAKPEEKKEPSAFDQNEEIPF